MLRLQGNYQTKKMAWMVLFFVLAVPEMVLAGHPIDGSTNAAAKQSMVWALKTNLLTDLTVMPSVGLEVTLAQKLSLGISGTYGWMDDQPWKENIRLATADMELRYWFGNNSSALLKGFHAGIYGAVYRYEFLFGGKGHQAKINWGTGISGGYTVGAQVSAEVIQSPWVIVSASTLACLSATSVADTRSMRSVTTNTTIMYGQKRNQGTILAPPRQKYH